jgi:hypothetical protein
LRSSKRRLEDEAQAEARTKRLKERGNRRSEDPLYFVSPVAYVVLAGFCLSGSFFFNLSRASATAADLQQRRARRRRARAVESERFVISPLLHNLSC